MASNAWTEKLVMALPPLLAGAVQFTVAVVSPAVAAPIVGAVGAVCAVPVPLNATMVGEPAPLLTMLTEAVCKATAVGVNVTLIVQVAAGASDAQLPAGACVAVKAAALAPVTLTADTVTVPVPALVTVIALSADVVPTIWLAKVRGDGVAVIAGTRNTGADNVAQVSLVGPGMSQNCNFSMLYSVSVPSVPAVSVTIVAPAAPGAIVYLDGGPM